MAGKHVVITIGRQYGSGGAEIGKQLAEKLGISFYDKNILRINADESGIKESYFHLADEKAGSRLLYRIVQGLRPEKASPSFGSDLTSADNLFRFQSEVIKKLAEAESCVIIGRCADYILEGTDDLVRIHLNADLESRKERIKERNPEETDVLRAIRKVDRERNDYYRYYTGRDWANSENYDLVINTTKPGISGTVSIILAYLRSLGYEV
ncbi:MAG: cytidylate kinase-like family protein [Clostridium sp.]|jgi:cytidylate kinase|nr:cytidylate kinase-like family protein [Clostridium sp.]MBQ5421846.1 cytidylate kinase-like family protein [Clostridium sp.]